MSEINNAYYNHSFILKIVNWDRIGHGMFTILANPDVGTRTYCRLCLHPKPH